MKHSQFFTLMTFVSIIAMNTAEGAWNRGILSGCGLMFFAAAMMHTGFGPKE
jgi:hypothetical protein